MAELESEMGDGSTPDITPLTAEDGRRLPLSAFTVLAGGDVFESGRGQPPADGPRRARAWFQAKVELKAHGAPAALLQRVEGDMVRQLAGNLPLIGRMEAARPLEVDLIPPGQPLARYGYPRSVSPRAAGLFWVQPEWARARIALRQDLLEREPHLVFHELAHAIQGLAFTEEENALVYRTLQRTYRVRSRMDEVFALYSEREFVPSVTAHDLRAPGVYGMARQRWNEEHVFTRFVRLLYFPYKPLAGPGVSRAGQGASSFG